MCYSQMRSPSLGYVKVLFKVRAVFIFSLEILICKILTFFWKGKNFMKCSCEKRTFVTLKWEALLWDMSIYCSKLEQCSFFLEALLWKIINFVWKGKNFMKSFCEKRTCVILKWEALVWNMSKFCSKLKQCTFSLQKLYLER